MALLHRASVCALYNAVCFFSYVDFVGKKSKPFNSKPLTAHFVMLRCVLRIFSAFIVVVVVGGGGLAPPLLFVYNIYSVIDIEIAPALLNVY